MHVAWRFGNIFSLIYEGKSTERCYGTVFDFWISAVKQSKSSPFSNSNSVWFKTGTVSSQQDGMCVCHDGAKTSSVDAAKYHAGLTVTVAENSLGVFGFVCGLGLWFV